MSNYDVKSIQEALYLCGFCPGKVDGKMGPNTEEAIRGFQKLAGLATDGIVGTKTAAALSGKLGESAVRASGLKGYFAGSGGSLTDSI